METSTILTADVLDILFEGRNKEYGAYDLRRTYKKRLTLSITVMLSVIFMLFIGFVFAGKKKQVDPVFLTKDIELASVEPREKPVEPPPPPMKPPAPPPVQVQTIRNTTLTIVPDDKVSEVDKPPVNADLENAKIGTMNNPDGVGDDGTVIAPPGDGNGNVVELPKKEKEDDDGIFVSVQIESEYPGGQAAWQRFLRKNLHYPQAAIDQGVQGFVVVQFVVDKDGNVSNVEAVSGPEELRAEAIRVIKKSGKWTPAVQNGRQVKSYKKQPLGFQLPEE
ncbi:TonB family protein [Niastella caeni]|uniref:TonB family protein n=1 Tax=Niastella caeni TaxID=2569763 RepID=A0A4V4H1N7_9BACT|nr:TonB family protein [Niastella caeni]THU41236.1 TonB family protein [Niastella caeni]